MGPLLPVKVWILGALTTLAGGVVAVVAYSLLSQPELPPAAPPAPVAAAPAAPAAAPPVAAPATDPDPAPTPVAVAEPVAPAFDVVRIAEDGGALVAGSAPAGAAVVLRVDEGQVAQTAADPAGQFVALFSLEPSETAQILTVEAVFADGRVLRSGERVVLTPRLPPVAPVEEPAPEVAVAEVSAPEMAAPEMAAAEPETPPATAEERIALAEPVVEPSATPDAPEAAPEAPAPPAIVEAAEPTPELPALAAAEVEETPMPRAFVVRESGAVQVLDRAPRVMDNVVVDVISYSDAGEVQISGRAAQGGTGARLQIYLDNQPVALALAENGDWASDLPDVDPGVYTLRVDQIGPEGRVVSRFETPFQREDPVLVAAARARLAPARPEPAGGTVRLETPAEATAEPAAEPMEAPRTEAAAPAPVTAPAAEPPAEPPVALITVQPGHSLWRISDQHYGEGARYVVIYQANRDQIRNPDLIYPGQVFVLPD